MKGSLLHWPLSDYIRRFLGTEHFLLLYYLTFIILAQNKGGAVEKVLMDFVLYYSSMHRLKQAVCLVGSAKMSSITIASIS